MNNISSLLTFQLRFYGFIFYLERKLANNLKILRLIFKGQLKRVVNFYDKKRTLKNQLQVSKHGPLHAGLVSTFDYKSMHS